MLYHQSRCQGHYRELDRLATKARTCTGLGHWRFRLGDKIFVNVNLSSLSMEMFGTPIKIDIGLPKQAAMNVLLMMRAEFNFIESCALQGSIRQR